MIIGEIMSDQQELIDALTEENENLRVEIENLRQEVLINKRARDEIGKVKTSLSEAQRIAKLGNWDWDIQLNTLFWSDEIYRIFGLKPREFGATYEAFLETLHPDDKEYVINMVNEALYGDSSYNIDHRIILPNGEVRIVHEKGEVTHESNKPIRMIGTVQDVTEIRKKEKELKTAYEAVLRSNEELEQFAYVASHDLQEPLRMVASYLQLLESRYGDKLNEDGKEFIYYAVDGAQRMKKLIQDLLSYSRIQSRGKPFEMIDLNNVLTDTLVVFKADIDDKILTIDSSDLPTVCADHSQMKLVFQNLISNGIKFRRSEVSNIHIDSKKDGEQWIISVHDDGIGIEPQYHERIFTMFEKLHSISEYEGTGIGLAITKRVIHRHNGKIWVESELEKGSTFHISIPIIECPEEKSGGCNERCIQ